VVIFCPLCLHLFPLQDPSVWLFGATKVYNNLEELLENLGCAFVIFLLLNLAWTIGLGGLYIFICGVHHCCLSFFTPMCVKYVQVPQLWQFSWFYCLCQICFTTTIFGFSLNSAHFKVTSLCVRLWG
jgi:hypothetical protein